MKHGQDKEEILLKYKKEGEKIVLGMFNILLRAHRKIEDSAYRDILQKLEKQI